MPIIGAFFDTTAYIKRIFMKYFRVLSMAIFGLCGSTTSFSQVTEAEVPGDHFSLEGALELFKKSESPEEFENLLNSPESKVNNLDLNGDGYTDYIRVIDTQNRNMHLFILQSVISESQSQDIAVIELEKLDNGKAVLQIIGDEDIYGVETIIEPTREVRTYAGTMSTTSVVNVWSWPVVYHVYSPYYVVWNSPWGWYHRPARWSPWRPVVFVHYYEYWRPYRPYYSGCHSHRIVYAHDVYYQHRSRSAIVRERHGAQLDRFRSTHQGNGRTTSGESQRNASSGGRSSHDQRGRMVNADSSDQLNDANNEMRADRDVSGLQRRSTQMPEENKFKNTRLQNTQVIAGGKQFNTDSRKTMSDDHGRTNFRNEQRTPIQSGSRRSENFNSVTRNTSRTHLDIVTPGQTERRASTTQRINSQREDGTMRSNLPSKISPNQQRSNFSAESMRTLKRSH
jgi:hypothetical protein